MPAPAYRPQQVLDFLAESGKARTSSDVVRRLGMTNKTAATYLLSLTKAGKVERLPAGGNSFYYQLARKGRA